MEKGSYYILGYIFLAIQLMVIFRNYSSDYIYFFWFCDFIPLVFAILFFLRQDQWIKGIVNIGFTAQLIYIFAFIQGLYTTKTIFAFLPPLDAGILYNSASIVIHLSTAIAFIALIRVKPTKETLVYSAISIILIFLVTLIFTSPQDGVNYVYPTESPFTFAIPYHEYLWSPIVFFLIALPTQGIQYIFYILTQKKNKSKEI